MRTLLRSAKLQIPGGPSFGLVRVRELDSFVTGVGAPALMGTKRQQLPSTAYRVTVDRLSQAQAELLADAFKRANGPAGVLIFDGERQGQRDRCSFREDSLSIRYASDAQASATFEVEVDPR